MHNSVSLPVQLQNRQLPLGVGTGPSTARHSRMWVQHGLCVYLISCHSAVNSQSKVSVVISKEAEQPIVGHCLSLSPWPSGVEMQPLVGQELSPLPVGPVCSNTTEHPTYGKLKQALQCTQG